MIQDYYSLLGGEVGASVDPFTLFSPSFFEGGSMYEDGFAYSFPQNVTYAIKLNTSTLATTQHGTFSGDPRKFSGTVISQNGYAFGIPRDSTAIHWWKLSDNTFGSFGTFSTTSAWQDGVLAQNGMIYGIPSNHTGILEIDPVLLTYTTFGSIAGSAKYGGGKLAPNGWVYCFPASNLVTQVMKFHPVTKQIVYFGTVSSAENINWSDIALASNGKMYCSSAYSDTVLVINTNDDTVYEIGSFLNTGWQTYGAVTAANEMVYILPGFTDSKCYRIDPSDDSITELFDTLGAQVYGGVLGVTGDIICGWGNTGMKVLSSPQQSASDNQIPADLADLPTSNYNRYHN